MKLLVFLVCQRCCSALLAVGVSAAPLLSELVEENSHQNYSPANGAVSELNKANIQLKMRTNIRSFQGEKNNPTCQMSPYGFLFDFEIHAAVSLLSKAQRRGETEAVPGLCPCLAVGTGSTHGSWAWQEPPQHRAVTSGRCHPLHAGNGLFCSGWGCSLHVP